MRKCFQFAVLFTFAVGLLSRCQTPIVKLDPPVTENTPLRTLQTKVMVEILTLAKEDQFRQFILAECLKQKHGDYNVYVQDIIYAYQEIDKYKKSMKNLQELVNHIKPLANNNEPLVFYPRAETIEDKLLESPEARISAVELLEPLGVFQVIDEKSSLRVTDMPEGTVDSYRVNINGQWVWQQYVDEEFAWENDVYVIGQEENVSSENMSFNNLRTEGRAEYAGIIKLSNLNAIEHWTSGKFEFKIAIVGSSGANQNMPFGKRKRKNFRNNSWYDFNYFVGNWYTNTYGIYQAEAWIEEDGGISESTTISIPGQNGAPTTSYTFPSKDLDDHLGQAIIQFNDPVGQEYDLG